MVLKKVGLTGASGMVGRHVLELLSSKGIGCPATSRSRPTILKSGVEFISSDLSQWRDPKDLDSIFHGIDVILHVGAAIPGVTAPSDVVMLEANVRSTLVLGEWALKNKVPFVFLSGAIVYTKSDVPGIRETDPVGSMTFGGFYGLTKYLAEQVLFDLKNRGLALCILRTSSIYGEGLAPTKMISKFLQTASAGGTIPLEQPIDDRINLIYAADVASTMLDVATADITGVFNIGGPELYSVHEIAQACVQVVGRGSVHISSKISDRAGISRFDLNSDLAHRKFGFRPKTSLRDGIQKMFNSVR